MYPDVNPPRFAVEIVDGQPDTTFLYGDYRYRDTSGGDINKFNFYDLRLNNQVTDFNIAIYRYADVLLMLAEAANRINKTAEAEEYFNMVRVARGLPLLEDLAAEYHLQEVVLVNDETEVDYNEADRSISITLLNDFEAVTQELVGDFILHERRFELFQEGKRWWDLCRTDKATEVMTPINGLTEDRELLPIYFEHLQVNGLLEQNEGY
jgi:hypothetical protein